MNKELLYKSVCMILVVALACLVQVSLPTASAQNICTDISHDLASGADDTVSDGSVVKLQDYLRSSGYLHVSSNGHFGPATILAVRSYQTDNFISATGLVGPITRNSIKQKTCSVATAAMATAGIPATQSTVSTPNPVSSISNSNITSPVTGRVLTVGSSTMIRWNVPMQNDFNISLEQPGGIGTGFVALDQSSGIIGNQYQWKVGKLYSTDTNSYVAIPPGTYRLRLVSVSGGVAQTDEMSGWFTIISSRFSISSVIPASVPADNTTSVVLFGTGLSASASVYFDANSSGIRANNQYASPDGTILVFTVPTIVASGRHTLYIDDGLSSSPLSLPIDVAQIQ